MNKRVGTVWGGGLLLLALSMNCAVGISYVRCGSRDAGFVVDSTGTLASLGTPIITKGKLDLDAPAQLTHDTRLNDSMLRIASTKCEARLTGTVAANSGAITLETTGDRLWLSGGQTPLGVNITANAEIGGLGTFGDSLTVGATKTLTLSLDSVLNRALSGDSGTVLLNSDLVLASGKKITVGTIQCNSRKVIFGDTNLEYGTGTTMSFDKAALVLNANITLSSSTTWKLINTNGSIEGGGNTLSLSGGVLDLNSKALAISDLKLADLNASGKILNGGLGIYATNSFFSALASEAHPASGTFRVVGEAKITTNGEIFADMTVETAADPLLDQTTVELSAESDLILGGTWTFAATTTLVGNECALNLSDGTLLVSSGSDLFISDAILAELNASSLNIQSGAGFYLANVTLFDDNGAVMHITGSANNPGSSVSQPAARIMPVSGDFFANNVTWANGALINLQKSVALGSTWTFSDTSHINAGGNIIDMSSVAGVCHIAAGKTLEISNAIIKNLKAGSFTFADANSLLKLHNCVITLASDVTLGGAGPVRVKIQTEGINTIVTGTHTLTLDSNASLTVNTGSSCYYDTLGTVDRLNVTTAGSGFVSSSVVSVQARDSRNLVVASNTVIGDSIFLYPDIGTLNGVQVQFTGDATLDGNGRTLFFAETSSISDHTMFTVNATKTAVTTNIVLEGAACSAFDIDGTLKFGNGTVIKLKNNDTLASLTYKIGAANNDVVTLDLGGNDLTFGADGIIALQNEDYSGLTLRIMNGRLVNVKSASFTAASTGADEKATVILQDVDMVLSDDFSSAKINWEIMGNCTLSGAGAYKTFTDANTAAGSFKIHSGARLTVTNGMTLAFSSAAHANAVTLVDRTSVLELIGGTLSSSLGSSLVIKKGTLMADHESTLTGNITLGDATDPLSILIMPGAHINLAGSGTIVYANNDAGA